jgi:branched-chain amino acid aminotransferase
LRLGPREPIPKRGDSVATKVQAAERKSAKQSEAAAPMQVYINGEFFPEGEAKVSVFDHTLLYGDGVFEGIRAYGGCIFRLSQHLDRFIDSAKVIMLDLPWSKEAMAEAVAETVRRNGLRDAYIRLLCTRGTGTLGLAPWNCSNPQLIVIAAKIRLYPEQAYREGLKIVTAPTLRNRIDALNGRVKSCNYLNNIMAKIEARNGGCDEAIMLDSSGFVVECTGDNIFLVKEKVITTPPAYLGTLKGVTRDCIIEIAREKGYTVIEEPFTRYEVFTADECFLTGTAAEVIAVTEVDKRKIGSGKPGAIARDLEAEFRRRATTDGHQVY